MKTYPQWIPPVMRTPYVFLGIGALVAFIALVFFLRGHSQEKIKKPLSVAVVKVVHQNLSHNVTLSAELQPFSKVTLYAKVAGFLKEIKVDIGDRVKRDEVLATLDVPEIKADLSKTKARYTQTKLDYDRILAVSKKRPGLVAQDEVDKAQEAYEVAKANYEHTQTLMDYTMIKAPFDGIVTNRYVDQGVLIQEGTNSSTQAKPLLDVAEDAKLRLSFPVPESVVTDIRVGSQADLKIQATGREFVGKIARFAGKVDEATRTMRTEIDVDNKDLSLKPGMYATVTLNILGKKDTLALPIQSVVINASAHVWVVHKDHKAHKKSVKTGIQTADFVEITDGLAENDMVIFGNHDRLKEGMLVEPKLIKEPTSKIEKG